MTDVTQEKTSSTVVGAPQHYHHGRTPAAWAGASVAFIGILIGGIGMIPHINWVVFSIGGVIFVIGGIVALVMRKLGYGAD